MTELKKNSVTVAEIIDAKRNLENEIMSLLNEFQAEMPGYIVSIDFSRISPEIGSQINPVHNVDCEVQVTLESY